MTTRSKPPLLAFGFLIATAIGCVLAAYNLATTPDVCADVYAQTIPDYQGEYDDVCEYDYMKGARVSR